MDSHVRIGGNRKFVLKCAVMIYTDASTAFATVHEVRVDNQGSPYLAAGRSLTTAFLRRLSQGLGTAIPAEVLSECVLARTSDMIVWWATAQSRVMFFGGQENGARDLNGHLYPHPPLLFKVRGRELFVRALAENTRPTAATRLKTAPYWNTDSRGSVCAGTMRIPDQLTANSVSAWEDAYFGSEFTHPSGAVRLTMHRQGFVGMWKSLKNKDRTFPTGLLTDAKETLSEFIESDKEF
jgi:PRTRC genetic system protein B